MYRVLFLLALVLVGMFGGVVWAQPLVDDKVYRYEGTINGTIPIEMMLERKGDELVGAYYYKKVGTMIALEGKVKENGTFWLEEAVFEDLQPCDGFEVHYGRVTGRFDGDIVGEERIGGVWSGYNEDKPTGKSFAFSMERVPYAVQSPKVLYDMLKGAKSDAEMMLVLSEYVLEDADGGFFIGGCGIWTDASFIGREDLEVKLYHKNLFGDSEDEIVVSLDFGGWFYHLGIFYRGDDGWGKVPGAISFARPDAGTSPCLSEIPGGEGDYVLFDFVEALEEDRYIIEGMVYGGRCADGSSRGDDIHYYLWSAQEGQIYELYDEQAHYYWYSSPSPAPVDMPVDNTFELVSMEGDAAPSHVKCTSVVYKMVKEKAEDEYSEDEMYAEEVGEEVKYIPLIEE